MAQSPNAKIGAGVTVEFWNALASPPAYETFGYVRNFSGFGRSRPEVDSTTLDSLAEEAVAGLPKGKTVTVKVTTNAAAIDLADQLAATDSVDVKATWPAPLSKTRYFPAIPIDDDQGSISASALMETDFQLRISGPITTVDPHASSPV